MRTLVKYKTNLRHKKIVVPQEIREGFEVKNDKDPIEVEIIPNKNCFFVYPKGMDISKLKHGLDIIRSELEE